MFAGMPRSISPNNAIPDRLNILVDPASNHMLVSKVKPCMCVYNFLHDATANGSVVQLSTVHTCNPTWILRVILEPIHAYMFNAGAWPCLLAILLTGFSPYE